VRWLGGALVALGLIAVAGRLGADGIGPAIVVARPVPEPPPTSAPPVTVARVPAPLPEAPVRAALARGVLWAAGRRAVYRVVRDEATRAFPLPLRGNGRVLDVSAGAEGVWLAVDDPGSVWRLDLDGTVTARIPTGRPLTGTVRIAVARDGGGDEAVWVACCGRRSGTVLRVDPTAGRVARVVRVPNGPTALDADGLGAMVTTELNELIEIPPAGTAKAVLRNNPGSLLHEVALTPEAAWVTVPGRGLVLRMDRAGGGLRSFRLPHGVRTLAAGRSGVWALSRDGYSVTPLSRAARPPFAVIPTGDGRPARQLLAGRSALWLVPDTGAGVIRLTFPDHPELLTRRADG
jgi:hypothetical protein